VSIKKTWKLCVFDHSCQTFKMILFTYCWIYLTWVHRRFLVGSCYSIFSFMCIFCRLLFVLGYFLFGHCIVCSSSIYGFWLPPFGIFKLFLPRQLWVPVKCETKRETKHTETKPNQTKRNEIHRNETKFTETKRNRYETKLTETKRNGIIQNEIKPILTKQFLGERQDKN